LGIFFESLLLDAVGAVAEQGSPREKPQGVIRGESGWKLAPEKLDSDAPERSSSR
jgi:hypothetical protein